MNLPLVHHPDYVTPLPPGHRFPMPKFNMLRDLLVAEGLATDDCFIAPISAGRDLVQLVHAPDYVSAFLDGSLSPEAVRRIGLPWSPGLVRRTLTAVAGTCRTVQLALEHGLACNTAGGTHHAFHNFGAGFCIFNDLAVAARLALDAGWADRVLIIDLDVHQGDGTAAIFGDEPAVFTFSLHCDRNFPARKQRSDLDVALPPETADEAYLAALAHHLPGLLDGFCPDLVLYDAGADPHLRDRLGRFALTDDGLRRRDDYVLEQCLGRELPTACVIGGGYSADLHELCDRHATLHRAATDAYARLCV